MSSTPVIATTSPVDSVWRHLDLGVWRLELRARLRRLECPTHGVRVEGVPFARSGARFTRDFEGLVAWLATRTNKTTIKRMVRVDWDTVGRIIERVCADELDPDRLQELFDIAIDEVSWRKQHRYLTLICDHRRRCVVWGAEGAGEQAADEFFTELGPARCAQLEAISLDMGPGYAKSARADRHAPQATICIDNYHVVQLATQALDDARRDYWNQLRSLGDQRGQALQRRPLGAAEESREPHRNSSRDLAQAQARRQWKCGAPTPSRKPCACRLTCGPITLQPPHQLHP